ncbi:SYVN1 ligase, partial [Poecile atricapillus]|nr:SYVN1 ligase [Poecile atricapillus]
MLCTALVMAGSLALTTAVVAHAYYLKHQFYPTVVYLTKSSPSMAVLYIQAFVLVFLLGKFMGKVFFGQLRAAEMEVSTQGGLWGGICHPRKSLVLFGGEFSTPKSLCCWLEKFVAILRGIYEPRKFLVLCSRWLFWVLPVFFLLFPALMFLLGILDFLFVSHAYHSILTRGASVQLVFGFEYAILMTMVLTIFIKYVLHSIDLQNDNPWDNKAVFMLYTELFTERLKVLVFNWSWLVNQDLECWCLAGLGWSTRTQSLGGAQLFKKAVTDAIMSRRAIRNMNTLYPDATAEELQAVDNVCIICREEMVTGAKRLPCNHIFHTSCLRSWFQRQQTCPTCRMDVLRASLPAQPPPEPPAPAPPPPGPQPPHLPQGILPPFPPGMFPFWPPVGPFPPVP